MQRLAELTWAEIRAAGAAGAVAVVPTGSLEQHGSHLVTGTDTVLVTAVAEGAAQRATADVPVLLAPTLWLGASHHHLPFFAASVDERTYVDLVVGIGCSLAASGLRRIFFLNGHGGNAAPLRLAVNEIGRGRAAALAGCAEYWALAAAELRALRREGPGGAAHAGEVETALMLHVAPGAVRRDRLAGEVPNLPAPFVRDLTDPGPVTIGVPWDRLTAGGALGSPTGATGEQGAAMLEACVAAAARAIVAFTRLDVDALRGRER